jgi:lycopene cyclase domain-containing protein
VSYTLLAALGIALAVALDLFVLRTKLLRRRVFWVSYAIILCFQLIVNGVLTGRNIVRYDSGTILGLRIAYAPVEDLMFGFSLVLQTLAWWVWWGRRLDRARSGGNFQRGGGRRRADRARTNCGSATPRRRGQPTATRRSKI